ncbi:hypothetical protein [Nocardiopsis alba]|uniref:hypothetical protein n=1 Tax=Nocardiopsis alba TaxID=53437 RepID=UPI0035DEB619
MQRSIVDTSYLWPTMLDTMSLQPIDTPGHRSRKTTLVKELWIGRQPQEAKTDKPRVLPPPSFPTRATVILDGEGYEGKSSPNRLTSHLSTTEYRQNLTRVDNRGNRGERQPPSSIEPLICDEGFGCTRNPIPVGSKADLSHTTRLGLANMIEHETYNAKAVA